MVLRDRAEARSRLNEVIAADQSLGEQFRVGHSYVTTPRGGRIDDPVTWFREVVETEIAPLLRELDIVLDRHDPKHPNRERRIIIDTKFTSILTKGRFRNEALRSGYLYQIYSYLRSQEKDDDPLSRDATGMLLHPAVEDHVYEAGVIQGHEIRFVTVDLTATGRAIRERLLSVVSENPAKG